MGIIDSRQAFKIGRCQIIPMEYAIQFDNEDKRTLQPKLIEVLCYLSEHYPRIIPREELIENIWAGNNYVGEKALTNTVWHLRQNLKGAIQDKEVIETIRKVGYRLLVIPQKIISTNEQMIHTALNGANVSDKFNLLAKMSKWNTLLPYALFTLIILVIWQYLESAKVTHLPVITQITSTSGSELFPSPSPDGRYIVYKWWTQGKTGNLFIQDNQQPQLSPKQLTFDDDIESFSVWSNDGKFLYYSHSNINDGLCEIMQLKIESNQLEHITDCPANISYNYMDISPNDETLAYQGFSELTDHNGIYFFSLTEDNAKPYRFSCANNCGYRERDFAFSPDGKSIAVTRRVNRFNENIFLVNLETKEAEQLTSGEEDIVGLTWHPNANSLIFASQRADVRHGFTLNLLTKEIVPLNITGFSYPAFSKKSGQLFYQQRTERYHLASLKLNESIANSPFPLIQSSFNHHYPHYSPVAKQLVYVSNVSGYYELWSTDNSGQNRKQLTNMKQTIRFPRWSHDGTKVAFLAPNEDKSSDHIYIIDIASKKLSVLASQFTTHNRPTWSFDDSAIISAVYDHEYTDLHRISIKNGTSKRLTFDGGIFGIMISPDMMLYSKVKQGLWLKNIDDNNPSLNKISGKKLNSTYGWTYHDNSIYYRYNETDSDRFIQFNLEKNQETTLAILPKRTSEFYGTLTFAPDLDKLFFAATQFPQVDIKSLNHPLID